MTNETDIKIMEAFICGFREAASHQSPTARTIRQAEKLHPELSFREIDAYIEGVGDQIRSDDFRLTLCLRLLEAANA